MEGAQRQTIFGSAKSLFDGSFDLAGLLTFPNDPCYKTHHPDCYVDLLSEEGLGQRSQHFGMALEGGNSAS